MIDTHTHMCLVRVRPLGFCLVTFPDSFTAQEGWRGGGRKWLQRLTVGWVFSFFPTATGSVTAPDSVCISSSCSTTLMSRSEDSSPTGNRAEQREKRCVDRRIMSIGQSCLLLLVWNQFILDLSSVGCWTWIRTQILYSVYIQSSACTKTDRRDS